MLRHRSLNTRSSVHGGLEQCTGRSCQRLASKRHLRWRVQVTASATQTSNGKSPERRVVVTGLGVVSTLGNEVTEFHDNLLAGKSGVTLIEGFDASSYSTKFAGEIKEVNGNGLILAKWEKRLDKLIKLIMISGKKALADAGLPWDGPEIKALDLSRCGILIGSAMGGMDTFSTAVTALHKQGYRRMNPFCIPFAISNMGGAMLAMDIGFMGPNYSLNTACATGNYCLLSAAQHIQRGDADIMLAGAGDAAVIPSGIGGFIACQALSKNNDHPTKASRPWDRNRDGFVMGEGAGVLVLEEYEHAVARGAPIYAEFAGGSVSCDAHHMTEPHPGGRGVILAINNALKQAGVTPEEVQYVNAHATSTKAGDLVEYRAIRSVMPQKELRMNSTKSMLGHLLGGAGGVEAVATVMALKTGFVQLSVHLCVLGFTTGWVHPTINLEHPDEGIDPEVVVANTKQPLDIKVALSNSFGFGGHNSCIVFKKLEA